ncbi:phospholipase D-like domain-containing protein [Cupriavidus sp. 30B13]|uniref:phospholipase D-like domain-containing protein n=1 Tax=Cupriavidus sp. 30B13 TaxID=3384241 RepID=UPI003B8F023F
MTQPSITVPIALSCTRSATITLPWFVQHAEYAPAKCTFTPLVNGEEAFRDVYNAIQGAQQSVDIICWGFQPSMFFRRGTDGQGTKCIGELLEDAGKRGVKVRVLCWGGAVLGMPEINNIFGPEPNMPNRPTAHIKTRPDARKEPEEFNRYWYWCVSQKDPRKLTFRNVIMDPWVIAAHIPSVWKLAAFENVEFMTRDFPLLDRLEITFRTSLFGTDKQRDAGNKATGGLSMGLAAPTHHQKMVLVDYEVSGKAVGYVMGHNMLDAYWDADTHGATRMRGDLGRNGATPRQDISSRVTGPILQYLNHNFCEAWDQETDAGLGKARKKTAANLKILPALGEKAIAQVLRTQSQKGKQDIEAMYLQAVNNTTKFVYIENQYFRFPPLADKIKAAAKAQLRWGRDPGEHGPLHLFVVTNSSDEGMGDGTVNTYRMLEALGRADTIPGVAKLEREQVRQADLERQYKEAARQQEQANAAIRGAYAIQEYVDSEAVRQKLTEAKQRLEQARRRQAELKAQMKEPPKVIVPTEIPGLKVHVCTLVAPDSPPGKWQDVYIHSKLMIVDDVFTTLGSANINTRSMEADSELNICHENAAVTQPLRQRLWKIHTKGKGMQDDPAEAFRQWERIIDQNAVNQGKGLAPEASLIQFRRDDPKRTNKD